MVMAQEGAIQNILADNPFQNADRPSFCTIDRNASVTPL